MRKNGKLFWALLAVCAATALLMFAYPMYVIRPFRSQGTEELTRALFVRNWAPPVASVAAAIAILIAAGFWRRSRRVLARALSIAIATLTVLFAALSHVNVYERMFHRIDSPETMPASEAKLESDDMVLAIKIDGHARAYPIRMMGYHHIANDWLGGVPVVATY